MRHAPNSSSNQRLRHRLLRDQSQLRSQPSEQLIESILGSLDAPLREAPRAPRRPLRLAIAASLLPLAGVGLWAFSPSPVDEIQLPTTTQVSSVTPSAPESPSWIAPQELLCELERGAELETQRLAADFGRVHSAILGNFPTPLRLESILGITPN